MSDAWQQQLELLVEASIKLQASHCALRQAGCIELADAVQAAGRLVCDQVSAHVTGLDKLAREYAEATS